MQECTCVEELTGAQVDLMDMAFNMGVPRLCKFKKMWNAVENGNFEAASYEMMDQGGRDRPTCQ